MLGSCVCESDYRVTAANEQRVTTIIALRQCRYVGSEDLSNACKQTELSSPHLLVRTECASICETLTILHSAQDIVVSSRGAN